MHTGRNGSAGRRGGATPLRNAGTAAPAETAGFFPVAVSGLPACRGAERNAFRPSAFHTPRITSRPDVLRRRPISPRPPSPGVSSPRGLRPPSPSGRYCVRNSARRDRRSCSLFLSWLPNLWLHPCRCKMHAEPAKAGIEPHEPPPKTARHAPPVLSLHKKTDNSAELSALVAGGGLEPPTFGL